MPDIFGINQKVIAATFARGDTFMLLNGDGVAIGLAQNVTSGYNRPLQPVFELGSGDISMANGRSEGTLQIARVIGSRDGNNITLIDILGEEFFEISSTSTGGTLSLNPIGGQGLFNADVPGGGKPFTCNGCFVIGHQFGGASQDVVIIESVQIQYISLEVD